MESQKDIVLLREYAQRHCEKAFAELVSRHIGFVYSAALRQVRDPHQAEEIAQAVFVILAQKAEKISDKTVLTGWLFKTTRYVALAQMRTENLRRRHEKETQMQVEEQPLSNDETWSQLEPLLDQALENLGEKDRQAVLLRFFEQKSLSEVGAVLGTGEDAARKRVSRALDKMNSFFRKRGIVSTAAILTAALTAHSTQAAPAALAKTVATLAVAKGATATGSTLTLVKGALKIMAWTKTKTALFIGAGLFLAASTGVFVVKSYYQDPDIQGAWEGVADVPLGPETIKMHGVLKIYRTWGKYYAKADSIEEGLKDISASAIEYKYPAISVQLDGKVNSSFNGTVDINKSEITGIYRENGLELPVVLKRTEHPITVPEPLKKRDYAWKSDSSIQGLWKGTLNGSGRPIRLNFKISEQKEGAYRGELDNLDGEKGQILTVIYQRPVLKLIVNSGAGMFVGKMDEAKTNFVGEWVEGGQMPLTIERSFPLYHAIPDNDPEVTARMRNLKMEQLRAKDCTADFWRELQQGRKANPELGKKIAAALGRLQNVTLVERTNDHGNPSFLYRMQFENMDALLFRLVLENGKIAYAGGYPEPE